MPHPNARLTIHGRRLLVDRVRAGRPVAHVADEMGISRTTAHKGVRRWRAEGDAGLSTPLSTITPDSPTARS
ncbi:helix-turn-helix domain-containing protein [Streptomyces sp. NPDC058299]|uniref:helix-turn-helix domain-containing protein n=1 Tax=unclassified Streptomyces TaxID=2593676 RepID=UPI0036E5B582